MVASAVVLDVNPGGSFHTDGHIGVAELVADEVVANFEIGFRHPVPVLHDGRPGDVAEFVAAWTSLEAFIAGRRLLAYGADYDRSALGKLLWKAGLPAPKGLRISCVLGPLLALHRPGELQSVMRDLGLFSAEEMDQRRREQATKVSGKWLLQDAADDALACARVAVWVAGQQGQSVGDWIADLPSRPVVTVGPPAQAQPRGPQRTVGPRLDPARLP